MCDVYRVNRSGVIKKNIVLNYSFQVKGNEDYLPSRLQQINLSMNSHAFDQQTGLPTHSTTLMFCSRLGIIFSSFFCSQGRMT